MQALIFYLKWLMKMKNYVEKISKTVQENKTKKKKKKTFEISFRKIQGAFTSF